MKRLWPGSLVGQLLLVVALMLLLAQGINSFLLYRGVQNQNLVESSTAAVSRIAFVRPAIVRSGAEAQCGHGAGDG